MRRSRAGEHRPTAGPKAVFTFLYEAPKLLAGPKVGFWLLLTSEMQNKQEV